MWNCTPTGSPQHSPSSPPPNGVVPGVVGLGFGRLEQQLSEFQEAERTRTPDREVPEEEAMRISWRMRCESLWASLPNEDMKDQSRQQIPDASYQCNIALTYFQLLANKLGFQNEEDSNPSARTFTFCTNQ